MSPHSPEISTHRIAADWHTPRRSRLPQVAGAFATDCGLHSTHVLARILDRSGVGAKRGRTGSKKEAAKPKKKAAKRKVAPKYKDPQSGATWSGRGLTPKWLAEKEKAGAKREEFLIKAAPAQAAKGKARG